MPMAVLIVFSPTLPFLLIVVVVAAAIPEVVVPLLLLGDRVPSEGLLGLLLLLEYRLFRWQAIKGIDTAGMGATPQTRGASAMRRRVNIVSVVVYGGYRYRPLGDDRGSVAR